MKDTYAIHVSWGTVAIIMFIIGVSVANYGKCPVGPTEIEHELRHDNHSLFKNGTSNELTIDIPNTVGKYINEFNCVYIQTKGEKPETDRFKHIIEINRFDMETNETKERLGFKKWKYWLGCEAN